MPADAEDEAKSWHLVVIKSLNVRAVMECNAAHMRVFISSFTSS